MPSAKPCRALWLVAALLVAGCGSDDAEPAPPPPPEVAVLTLASRPVQHVVSLPGRVQAVRIAEVRARVTGIVERRLYEEGGDVQAGQPLFRIDPREMQAALQSAQATLQRAEATAQNAAQDLRRYRGLVQRQALSQQEYDAAEARLRTARADVAQARAGVETARLNLAYTRVQSPIAGIAGRAEVTEGALVSAGEGTLMTRVEQFDPVYVNFAQSSADRLALQGQVESGALRLSADGEIEVTLELENGQRYPHPGRLDFRAMSIDQATGTVALRARVPNPDRQLLPGQFVRTRVNAGTRAEGLAIPQRAVRIEAREASVLVVGDDDTLARRAVELGEMLGGQWVVRAGLAPGLRIVADPGHDLREGTRVTPVETTPAGGTTDGATPEASAPDAAASDAPAPNVTTPDPSAPDASEPDAPAPDAAPDDAAPRRAASP